MPPEVSGGTESQRAKSLANLKPWAPGQSGNPAGVSKQMLAVRKAVDDARNPEQVREMLQALFERGIAGDNFASKLWLEHIVPVSETATPDLSTASDETLAWLEQQTGN